ncbi:hypothetical protein PIB30_004274 [Stylosanthes scabra]|uniref:Uncharacterized protein n=1 Tax=Stylosanthes scabra TaxID=79078 RepID=A0ABU6T3C8_9FABA|nr:hypothetical protein [Stylosanthes scabra]
MGVLNPCTLVLMNSIAVPSPSLPLIKSFRASPKAFPSLTCFCSINNSNSSESEEEKRKERVSLSGIVNEQVEELLSKEENKSLLDGLEQASLRVEMAKKQLAFIEEQELAAKKFRDYVNKLEGQASEIAECQREISEAKALVEEAERALSVGESGAEDSEGIDRDKERLESVKAASIAALVGTLSGLPICFTQQLSALLKVLQPWAVDQFLN